MDEFFVQALVGVPRDSYYIGSKVGRYDKDTLKMFDFSAEKTAAGLDNTLSLLGLDYVDLIQVSEHCRVFFHCTRNMRPTFLRSL